MGDVMKLIGGLLVALALLFGVLFLTGTVGNLYDSTVTRQSLDIQRENFEHSKSYVHSKVDDLAKYKREYDRAKTADEKAQVRNWVLGEFANFDKALIENRDLRSFLAEMEGGQ